MTDQFEAKCVNPECPANEVWVLDADERCNTCDHELVGRQPVPTQKMADPDQVPDPDGATKGS